MFGWDALEGDEFGVHHLRGLAAQLVVAAAPLSGREALQAANRANLCLVHIVKHQLLHLLRIWSVIGTWAGLAGPLVAQHEVCKSCGLFALFAAKSPRRRLCGRSYVEICNGTMVGSQATSIRLLLANERLSSKLLDEVCIVGSPRAVGISEPLSLQVGSR